MENSTRKQYNQEFTTEKYQQFIADFDKEFPNQLDFRVAESPIFVTKEFKNKLIEACESIVDVISADDFKEKTQKAIPINQVVPNENEHTSFLAIDFAVCQDKKGEYIPQLIELQGFPSVFGFQYLVSKLFQKHFSIPSNFDFLFGKTREEYVETLRKLIIGNENPENVILLEIYPEKQKTKIDFAVTEKLLGVKAVCLTKIIKEGKQLFYELDGKKIHIKRIYNRLIFDDLIVP